MGIKPHMVAYAYAFLMNWTFGKKSATRPYHPNEHIQ